MNILNKPTSVLCLLLPIGLGVYYCWVVSTFGYVAHISDTMFFYPDSLTYASVADWISTGSPTNDTINRPVLYPLLMIGPKTVAGEYGIWILQFFMWVAAASCLFWTLIRMGVRKWATVAATLIFCGNFTLLLLTLHALSETLTLFLLSLGMVLFPICLVFGTSGLTFWQADRIVAPVVPVWIVLHTLTLRALYNGFIQFTGPYRSGLSTGIKKG